jgi:hypothetical protein
MVNVYFNVDVTALGADGVGGTPRVCHSQVSWNKESKFKKKKKKKKGAFEGNYSSVTNTVRVILKN